MALECVCFATQSKGSHTKQVPVSKRMPKHCEDPRAKQLPKLKDIDLCEIVKRSEDENSKHNDHECHLKGEKRQNLINKIKMYLDDYDDRPVMKTSGKGGDEGKALGQTGFGPLIKYPGYVDYNHPFFSDPYNKMPTLATTVGQRGENPCVPLQVRNWDECHQQTQGHRDVATVGAARDEGNRDHKDGRCYCAKYSGEIPRCPAAGESPSGPAGCEECDVTTPNSQIRSGFILPPRQITLTPQTPSGLNCRYICIPLPDDS